MITNDVAVVVTQHWQSNTSQNREPDCAACFAENQLLEPRTASNDPENQNPAAEGKTTSKPAEEVITDSAVNTHPLPSAVPVLVLANRTARPSTRAQPRPQCYSHLAGPGR